MWVRRPWHPTEAQQRRRRAFGYATLADGATFLEDLNANRTVTIGAGNVQLRLRLSIQCTSGSASSPAFKFRYSHNSGAYTDITGASTHIQVASSAHFSDGDDVEPQLLGSAAPFLNENAAAESSTGTFTFSGEITTGDTFETEVCLLVIDAAVSDTDTIDIRLYESDNSAFDSYTQTPQLIMSDGGGIVVPVFYHHLRTMWNN